MDTRDYQAEGSAAEAAPQAAGLPAPGAVIGGKYRVERVLGQGGMGVVVAARHAQLGHEVAIKLLLPEVLGVGDAVERFLREARAVVRLRSEHVVRVFDVDTLPGGAPYVVMELLAGRDLADVVAARGPLPVAEAVDYLLQACVAVAEAHAAGIVHRDLKPANLFLAESPDGGSRVKVLDFGISKVTWGGAEDKSLTSTRAVMGSPQYMSPEQVRSPRTVDARADVWALGVILHQLLTGNAPFDGDTVFSVCAQIMSDPPAPLRATRPDVPAELESVVLACLQKDREQRIQNVGALARALQSFASPAGAALVERIAHLAGLPRSAAPTVVGPAASAAVALPAASPPPPATARTGPLAVAPITTPPVGPAPLNGPATDAVPRRRLPLLAVVGGVVVLGLGGAVIALLGSARRPAPSPAVPPVPVTVATPHPAPGAAPASVPAAASQAAAVQPLPAREAPPARLAPPRPPAPAAAAARPRAAAPRPAVPAAQRRAASTRNSGASDDMLDDRK
jgi:serine/threonine-protein kinase